MTNRLRSKARRGTLVLALAGASLAAPFSLGEVGAATAGATAPAKTVAFTVHVPPIVATTPTLVTVDIDGQPTTVGGDEVPVTQGGDLTLRLTTTQGTINVTRDETVTCPPGETGAVILVTGAITNVKGTATFTPTGDLAALGGTTVPFEVPNPAKTAKATICAAVS